LYGMGKIFWDRGFSRENVLMNSVRRNVRDFFGGMGISEVIF